MATQTRKRRLSSKARNALELLVNRPFGVSERLLLACGFSRRMMLGLVKQGLATQGYAKQLEKPSSSRGEITGAG
jgi:hypothetical protein